MNPRNQRGHLDLRKGVGFNISLFDSAFLNLTVKSYENCYILAEIIL